jgi:hypothetical protein
VTAYLPDKTNPSSQKQKEGSANEQNFDDELSSCMFGFHIPLESAPENPFELSQKQKMQQLVTKNIADWGEE